MTRDQRLAQTSSVNVPEMLTRCRRLARPALEEAVGELHPWPAEMAAFSFGWDGAVTATAGGTGTGTMPGDGRGGGKGLRPALVLTCARAAGAPAESALAGAVAVELVHAFSLVHDDIMDGDERRRHRATAWKVYGVGPAVLAGDALLALAMSTLARASGAGAGPAMARLSAALVELVHGQAEDIRFESRPWSGTGAVTVEEYLAMAEAKTGALLGCAATVGTLLGGGSPDLAAAMGRMGRDIGVAFQITDDVLGIWGDPAITGKPAASDLRLGKKTFPVLAALGTATPAAGRLARSLGAPSPSDATWLDRARALADAAGGRALAHERARAYLERALRVIGTAGVPEPAAAELAALCRFLARRTR